MYKAFTSKKPKKKMMKTAKVFCYWLQNVYFTKKINMIVCFYAKFQLSKTLAVDFEKNGGDCLSTPAL